MHVDATGVHSPSQRKSEESLLTPIEVAGLLRVPLGWIYAHQKDIPGLVRLGRYVRFRRHSIEKFLTANLTCEEP